MLAQGAQKGHTIPVTLKNVFDEYVSAPNRSGNRAGEAMQFKAMCIALVNILKAFKWEPMM